MQADIAIQIKRAVFYLLVGGQFHPTILVVDNFAAN
jgi:hypothetical protein